MKKNETKIPKPPFYSKIKTPTIIQMEAIECGAACLGIVLGYYGKYIPLEELRVACGVSRDGANALNILKAAESYGLQCEGYKLELEEVYDMPLPLVAFWDFNHFVVIEGFTKNYVLINDPASGHLQITYEEFEHSFTGLALTFEATPAFQKSGTPPSTFDIIYKRLKGYEMPLLFAILAGILIVIPKLAYPAFTQVFIDNILVQGIYSWSSWFLFGMAIVIALLVLFFFLQEIVLSRLMIKMSTEFSNRFLWHIMYLPISFYMQRYSGEVANRMPLNDEVAKAVTQRLAVIVIDALSTTIFGIVMFYYDPLIALFGVCMTIGNVFLMRYLYQSRVNAYAYFQKSYGKSMAYSISSISNMETIKTVSMENQQFSRWAGYYTKKINSFQEIDKKDVILGIIPEFLQNLTLALVICIGAWRVINGFLTIGMLIALRILMQNFMTPIVSLFNSLQTIQLLVVDFNRIDDVLKNPIDQNLLPEKNIEPKRHDFPKLKGGLEIRDVTFGYNPLADAMIRNASFALKPGQTTAIVGRTGCGKSTLVKIIGGLFHQWSGEVFFDQIERSQIPRDIITNSLSIVEQDPFIFSATIKENLTCFETIVDENEMVQAAKDACIHDEIVSRHGGYEVWLDNEGVNISSGQRQQLEIARALIRRPTILILDEATNSVDSETELKIFQNIKRRGCTCIIVAHRLSTIRYCDEIVVMDKGQIMQKGIHEDLIKKGLYKSLIEAEENG